MNALLVSVLLAAPVDFVEHSGFVELDITQKTQLKAGVAAAWPDSLPANISRLDCARKEGVLGCSPSDIRAGTPEEQLRPGDYPYTIAWRALDAGELVWLESWLRLTWPTIDIEKVETVEVERARGGIWVHIEHERTVSAEAYRVAWDAQRVVRRVSK